MKMRNHRRESGNTLVEFTLAGIPVIFLIFSTIQLGTAMWNYHTLQYAVNEAAQYAAVRGQGCSSNGNTCGTNVGTLAHQIASAAPGISADVVNVTLTTASGQTTPCAPLSSCYSRTAAWPPSANNDNAPGKSVTISARYQYPGFLAMFWPGVGASQFGQIVLPAISTQQIVF
jgi:Flp pilus assembly protein TadG